MIVTRLTVRDFRSYEAAELRPGPGLTVIAGRNGAGKTNLLEALYFACTGRSCRTANERESVRFGAALTRLELEAEDANGRHSISVGFQPGEPKHLRVDGAPVDRLTDSEARPLVAVFLPDRLELVLGAPALRRAHLDQVVAAMWPARGRHAARVLGGARPAQRADLGGARRPRLARLAPGLGRRAGPPRDRADAGPRRGDRPAGRPVRRPRRRARARGRGDGSSTGRARVRRASTSSSQSSGSAPTATSSAASPATGRTATTCRCAATGASCAPTARAARCGSGCWRSCSPSARSWRPSAAPRRCSCSTT